MAISLLPQLFFIFILAAIITSSNATHTYSQCRVDQKKLLLQLKNDLIFNSSASTKLAQWNQTDDCCSWHGVECDGLGYVINLQLDDEAISGGLENSQSLFSLSYLRKLNLANNDFNNHQIPKGIHNLTQLSHLNLSHAGFGGQVPGEISFLRRLVSLDISGSYMQFLKIESPSLKMLLQNLTGLKELYLDGVVISSEKNEWCHIISSHLPDLRNLSLRHCSLSGPLDVSLLQLHSLSVLQLDGNELSTVVPDFFANFSSLTALSLGDCYLKGYFPEMIFQLATLQFLDLSQNYQLKGTIPTIFAQSGSFRSIVLSSTNFSGPLSNSIANHRMLSTLDLNSCRFTGVIPSLLSNLTSLVSLDLSGNFFSGSIANSHFEGLSSLVYLNLEHNSFSGSIPRSLFGLPYLQTLKLNNNGFSGQVDEFSFVNISHMLQLDLSSNQLEGPIPHSFFHLQSLEHAVLSKNMFNGSFQLEHLQMLPNLTYLDLSYNSLSIDATNTSTSSYRFSWIDALDLTSCKLHNFDDTSFFSIFPNLYEVALRSCNLQNFPDFRKHKGLNYLDLSDNQITGDIPSWIWEIGTGFLWHLNLSSNLLVDFQKPYNFSSRLETLDLHSNQLRGELPLPPPIASNVDYSNNNFENSIPPDIGNFPQLTFLSLANNSLSGSIPTSLCNDTFLQLLDLSFNDLSGNIPPCLMVDLFVEGLILESNNLSGDIPDNFSVSCSLSTLDLSHNSLGGSMPKSMSNCKELEILNVGHNNIYDSFPCMLSPSLRVLILRSNRFQGEIRCERSWPSLQIIDISSNDFSGSLHLINFSSWTQMMLAHTTDYHLGIEYLGPFTPPRYLDTLSLIIKGLELKLVKIREDFTAIDFSCNNFHGEIPDSVGELRSLYLLNLSHNSLNGTIPNSFGNLTLLGALDLSMNQLTGAIPVELASLTFLSVLNLSYNKLVGVIPNGRQFLTFSGDSFEGNSRLCGFPLNISCNNSGGNASSPSEHENGESKREIEWEYVSAALGYVVGLGGVVWLLLFCRSYRERYFEKIEEVVEEMVNGRKRRRRRRARRRRVENQGRRH